MAVEPTSIIDELCAALAPVTRQAGMAMALLCQYKQQTFQSHSRYAASHAIQSCILGLPAPREVNPERVIFSCKKVKAKTEIYMGEKKILKIME